MSSHNNYRIEHNFALPLMWLRTSYGDDMQDLCAIEEMSELTKELCKRGRGKGDQRKIIEETADVLITVLQIAEMYGYDAVMDIVDQKLNRALGRKTPEQQPVT